MERITFYLKSGEPTIALLKDRNITEEFDKWILKAVPLIAAYEDTNLTPEEIIVLVAENRILKMENQRLKQEQLNRNLDVVSNINLFSGTIQLGKATTAKEA